MHTTMTSLTAYSTPTRMSGTPRIKKSTEFQEKIANIYVPKIKRCVRLWKFNGLVQGK